jgi:hypothetical protein
MVGPCGGSPRRGPLGEPIDGPAAENYVGVSLGVLWWMSSGGSNEEVPGGGRQAAGPAA